MRSWLADRCAAGWVWRDFDAAPLWRTPASGYAVDPRAVVYPSSPCAAIPIARAMVNRSGRMRNFCFRHRLWMGTGSAQHSVLRSDAPVPTHSSLTPFSDEFKGGQNV